VIFLSENNPSGNPTPETWLWAVAILHWTFPAKKWCYFFPSRFSPACALKMHVFMLYIHMYIYIGGCPYWANFKLNIGWLFPWKSFFRYSKFLGYILLVKTLQSQLSPN
jgi:hypothetical protein